MAIKIHVYNDSTKLDQILVQLTAISTRLTTIFGQEISIMAVLKDLDIAADAALAAITDESNKDDAIIALVKAGTAQLTQLRVDLAAALASSDPVATQAVLDKLKAAETNALANSARVLAAINAGVPPPTPAVPV